MIPYSLAINGTPSTSVLLNILGILRWAKRSKDGLGWEVEATHWNGTLYQAYYTTSGTVVWDVAQQGGYPDTQEWVEMEAAL